MKRVDYSREFSFSLSEWPGEAAPVNSTTELGLRPLDSNFVWWMWLWRRASDREENEEKPSQPWWITSLNFHSDFPRLLQRWRVFVSPPGGAKEWRSKLAVILPVKMEWRRCSGNEWGRMRMKCVEEDKAWFVPLSVALSDFLCPSVSTAIWRAVGFCFPFSSSLCMDEKRMKKAG